MYITLIMMHTYITLLLLDILYIHNMYISVVYWYHKEVIWTMVHN